MRILVVSNLYPPAVRGGYEVECAGVVDHLRSSHEVRVLTSREGSGGDGVVRAMDFLTPDARGRVRSPLAAVRGVRAARRLAVDFRPELVYVWNGSSIPQVALYELFGLGVPVAVRVCEHWFGRLWGGDQFLDSVQPGSGSAAHAAWGGVARAVNRLDPVLRVDLARRTPASVSWVSAFLRERAGVPAPIDALHEEVLHPATPQTDRFLGVERAPELDPPLILFAGRLQAEKGPDVAIRAVAALEQEHGIRARLLLAGPGDAEELLALAGGLGVDIEAPGALEPDALRAALSRAAVWLMPAVWEEPAPTTAIEGALARVPMVASRAGGIPELIPDGEYGLLFAPGDADDAARALAAALRDPSATAARTERAHTAALGKRHGQYLDATDRFIERAVAAHPG